MGMNQEILIKLLDGLKQIQKESYPLCDHTEADVSHRNVNINKQARELQVMLEYFFKSNVESDSR